MAELGPLTEEMVLAHFIVSDDVEHTRRTYTECWVAECPSPTPEG
jgi:hypothetical protein